MQTIVTMVKLKLKVLLETYIECDVFPDDYINHDTIEDYKEQLQCDAENDALNSIWENKMKDISEDCKIISVEPYDEGIEIYEQLINNWNNPFVN